MDLAALIHALGGAVIRSLDLIIPERFRARSGTTRYGADVLRVPASRMSRRSAGGSPS